MSNVTTIVIVGGTGDLARRKLLPALVHLASKGRLPDNVSIVGFARAQHDDTSYRELMWSGAREFVDSADIALAKQATASSATGHRDCTSAPGT